MVCPAFTANAAGPPHTAARAAVSRARAARRSEPLMRGARRYAVRPVEVSSLGDGIRLGSPKVPKEPFGFLGRRVVGRGQPSRPRAAPGFETCGDGEAMASTSFGIGRGMSASWCRVQGRRGARHNGGCVHPQGAKAPAVAVWTPRERSERLATLTCNSPLCLLAQASNPAATAKVRAGSMPARPCSSTSCAPAPGFVFTAWPALHRRHPRCPARPRWPSSPVTPVPPRAVRQPSAFAHP